MSKEKFIVCIPARFGSTRFPGKVLAKLGGKPILKWVYDKGCASNADNVIVATDNSIVYDTVVEFGGKCVMTKDSHQSGTDRIWEAVKDIDCDVIINIQADEPLIEVSTINKLIDLFKNNPRVKMATVVVISDRKKVADNPNIVKAILSKDGSALYFSRSLIPYAREKRENFPVYRHLGIYGYRKNILKKFVSLPQSELEKCEMLEQLRALDNNIKIHTVVLEEDFGIGIDTPEDLQKAEMLIQKKS